MAELRSFCLCRNVAAPSTVATPQSEGSLSPPWPVQRCGSQHVLNSHLYSSQCGDLYVLLVTMSTRKKSV